MASVPELFSTAYQHYEAGHLEQAESQFHQVLASQPAHAGALYGLGAIAYHQGRYAVAVNYFGQAVAANPSDALLHSSRGAAYQAVGRFAEALLCHQQALALQPDSSQVLNNLGITLVSLGRLREALAAFDKALHLAPEDTEVLNNLGAALRTAGRAAEAIPHYRRALELRPDFAQAHQNLANAWTDLDRVDEAVASSSRAIELRPDLTAARLTLGVALAGQGRLAEARDCLREAHERAPHDLNAYCTYLCCLNYDPAIEPQTLAEAHRRWGEAQVPGFRASRYPNRPDPKRRLRIGYVSPDFRSHAVCYFVAPLLACHAREQVEVVCYADVARLDDVTTELRARADHWRDTTGLPDEQLAELIRQDTIDILVDLAGHTSHHRLLLFARKPAPVQVSYLGYPCTSGLPTIDYRLVDAVTDPPDEPNFGHEELVRLEPLFCCYAPPYHAPPVAPLPLERNRYLTFGSLHKLEKLNDTVLDTWCAILKKLPAAHLLLCRHVINGKTADLLRQRFEARGIESSRVELRSAEPVALHHLRLYDEIDVALDTWPWNGHTTACEALWMGVPVLTLRGDRHASRMVASVLTCLELGDWIAETPQDYFCRALTLASRRAELAELRGTLRERLRRSPLCDGQSFCRGLEAAYRRLWQRWCQQGLPQQP